LIDDQEFTKQQDLRSILLEEASNFKHKQFYDFTLCPLIISILYICFTGLIKPLTLSICSNGWIVVFVIQLLLLLGLAIWVVIYL